MQFKPRLIGRSYRAPTTKFIENLHMPKIVQSNRTGDAEVLEVMDVDVRWTQLHEARLCAKAHRYMESSEQVGKTVLGV